MATILLIEDEAAMARSISDALRAQGYKSLVADNGEKGIQIAGESDPDLILLDIMLPGIDGFEVCKELRSRGKAVPIVMLTARSEEVDKVVGLELGADDYMTKPFSTRELLARIKAHLRRSSGGLSDRESIQFGDVTVHFKRHEIIKNGEPVELTSTELSLLEFLVRNAPNVVSRETLLNEVWGYDIYPETRLVDTHILNLRKKIENEPQNPRHILTVHGSGYKFVE